MSQTKTIQLLLAALFGLLCFQARAQFSKPVYTIVMQDTIPEHLIKKKTYIVEDRIRFDANGYYLKNRINIMRITYLVLEEDQCYERMASHIRNETKRITYFDYENIVSDTTVNHPDSLVEYKGVDCANYMWRPSLRYRH